MEKWRLVGAAAVLVGVAAIAWELVDGPANGGSKPAPTASVGNTDAGGTATNARRRRAVPDPNGADIGGRVDGTASDARTSPADNSTDSSSRRATSDVKAGDPDRRIETFELVWSLQPEPDDVTVSETVEREAEIRAELVPQTYRSEDVDWNMCLHASERVDTADDIRCRLEHFEPIAVGGETLGLGAIYDDETHLEAFEERLYVVLGRPVGPASDGRCCAFRPMAMFPYWWARRDEGPNRASRYRRRRLLDLDGDSTDEICIETIVERDPGPDRAVSVAEIDDPWQPARRGRKVHAFGLNREGRRLIRLDDLDEKCPADGYDVFVDVPRDFGGFDEMAVRMWMNGERGDARGVPPRFELEGHPHTEELFYIRILADSSGPLELRDEPRADAPVVGKLALRAGDQLRRSGSRIVVDADPFPSPVAFRITTDAVHVDGPELDLPVEIAAGERIAVTQKYGGEGTYDYYVWYDGSIYRTYTGEDLELTRPEVMESDAGFATRAHPKSRRDGTVLEALGLGPRRTPDDRTWWVRVDLDAGAGWFRPDHERIRVERCDSTLDVDPCRTVEPPPE